MLDGLTSTLGLLWHVRSHFSERKWRLYACACARRLPNAGLPPLRQAIELAERFADGEASAHELAAMRFGSRNNPESPAGLLCWAPDADHWEVVRRLVHWIIGSEGGFARWEQHTPYLDLLREVAGPDDPPPPARARPPRVGRRHREAPRRRHLRRPSLGSDADPGRCDGGGGLRGRGRPLALSRRRPARAGLLGDRLAPDTEVTAWQGNASPTPRPSPSGGRHAPSPGRCTCWRWEGARSCSTAASCRGTGRPASRPTRRSRSARRISTRSS